MQARAAPPMCATGYSCPHNLSLPVFVALKQSVPEGLCSHCCGQCQSCSCLPPAARGSCSLDLPSRRSRKHGKPEGDVTAAVRCWKNCPALSGVGREEGSY